MKFHKISNSVIFSIAVFVSMMFVNSVCLYAHGILSKETETGKVRFSYDNGSPMASGFIDVYDKDGKEIAKGQTDAEGAFDYSMYENVGKISVSDTQGHHQTHVIGGAGQDHSSDHHGHTHDHNHDHDHTGNNNFYLVIGVVAVLLMIAAVFYLGNKKKTTGQQKK